MVDLVIETSSVNERHCHSAMHVYENYFQTSLKLLITITEVEHIEH